MNMTEVMVKHIYYVKVKNAPKKDSVHFKNYPRTEKKNCTCINSLSIGIPDGLRRDQLRLMLASNILK